MNFQKYATSLIFANQVQISTGLVGNWIYTLNQLRMVYTVYKVFDCYQSFSKVYNLQLRLLEQF